MIFPTIFVIYILLKFLYALELYTLAYSFILSFGKWLSLELISYLIYDMQSFCFKFFIIKRIKLVLINIIIDKLVLD